MNTKKLTKRFLAAFMALFIFSQVFAVTAWAGDNQSYKNGSTKEYVYSTVASCNAQGSDYIGYLFPYETATVYGYYAGCYIIEYLAGNDLKYGFVKYNGGNKDPYWHPQSHKNGATKSPVYSSLDDAYYNRNSIGSLDPFEDCTRLGIIVDALGWCYGLVLYTAGNTPKTGLVNMGHISQT